MDTTMLRGDSIQALMQLVRRMFLEIHTCIPGEIVAFDKNMQLATVKSCIRTLSIDEKGNKEYIDPPQVIDVPVVFLQSQTNGFSFTYPVNTGDQCLLFFSERSYDQWLELGSVQNPSETGAPLSHQYTDAFALVGISPLVSSIQDFQDGMMELRNRDRSVRFSLSDDTIVVHNNRVEVILNKDNFITKIDDGSGTTLASITINKDGDIKLYTVGKISAEADTVDVTANTVSCLGRELVDVSGSTCNVTFSDVINITCPNIIITGDILVDGELYAKTYMVGPDPNERVGVIAGNDTRIERDNVWDKPDSQG